MFDPGLTRGSLEQFIMRVIPRQDSLPARFHTQEDFRLGAGDPGGRAEEFHMHRFDGGDQGDMRPYQAGEGGDFARMVHADLEDRELAVAGKPGQRQGNAPLIIQIPGADIGRAMSGEGKPQHLFGAGFADAAGDGQNAGPGAGPGGSGQGL